MREYILRWFGCKDVLKRYYATKFYPSTQEDEAGPRKYDQ